MLGSRKPAEQFTPAPSSPIYSQKVPHVPSNAVILSRSDERARRVSAARAERAVQYRFSRMAHAVRLQTALQQQREAEAAAAASSGEAELQPVEAAVSSHINLIIKADVQACALLHAPFHSPQRRNVSDSGAFWEVFVTGQDCLAPLSASPLSCRGCASGGGAASRTH